MALQGLSNLLQGGDDMFERAFEQGLNANEATP